MLQAVPVRTESGKLITISSKEALVYLRKVVVEFGESKLGFTKDEVGIHSIRSGGAMAMYLSNIPVYTIMLLGRWSSDAFLLYIRKQVQQFSAGVAERMVAHQDFYTIPDLSPEDPRSRKPLLLSGRGLHHGLSAQSFASQPAFSAFG
jgi:hypothetical protein